MGEKIKGILKPENVSGLAGYLPPDEIIKVLKSTGVQVYEESELPDKPKAPYGVYKKEDMKTAWLEIQDRWQCRFGLSFYGHFDRQSPDEKLPLNIILKAVRDTVIYIGKYILVLNQVGWKRQDAVNEKVRDNQLTIIDFIFSIQLNVTKIGSPEEKEIKKESK